MAKQNYRIVIPTDVENYEKLIKNIKKKNDSMAGASPLGSDTDEINQGVLDMKEAAKLEEEADELKRLAEEKIEQRNILWKKQTLTEERGWRKKLEGEYIKSIHKMGEWGYEVDTSPKAKPKPAVK